MNKIENFLQMMEGGGKPLRLPYDFRPTPPVARLIRKKTGLSAADAFDLDFAAIGVTILLYSHGGFSRRSTQVRFSRVDYDRKCGCCQVYGTAVNRDRNQGFVILELTKFHPWLSNYPS